MAAQHLRAAIRQMKLAPAHIDPHVGVRHHQVGIAGQPEAGDIKQRRQPLVGDRDVDMLEMDRIAEILCGAVELLHGKILDKEWSVARMQRSAIRESFARRALTPDFAALHPGYESTSTNSP